MLRFALPRHLRPRREKVFGNGPRVPLDREAKVRITRLAEALKHRTEPKKHYGVLTGKFVDVLHALLWLIHDGRSGQCNPAYATIAGKAGCEISNTGRAKARNALRPEKRVWPRQRRPETILDAPLPEVPSYQLPSGRH